MNGYWEIWRQVRCTRSVRCTSEPAPKIIRKMILCVWLAGVLSFFWSAPLEAQMPPFDLYAALATAQPDATITVPAGLYQGSLTIDKPVTLVADRKSVV